MQTLQSTIVTFLFLICFRVIKNQWDKWRRRKKGWAFAGQPCMTPVTMTKSSCNETRHLSCPPLSQNPGVSDWISQSKQVIYLIVYPITNDNIKAFLQNVNRAGYMEVHDVLENHDQQSIWFIFVNSLSTVGKIYSI